MTQKKYKFYKGQQVVCISKGDNYSLEVGKVYTIYEVCPPYSEFIRISFGKGYKTFYKHRFVPYQPPPPAPDKEYEALLV